MTSTHPLLLRPACSLPFLALELCCCPCEAAPLPPLCNPFLSPALSQGSRRISRTSSAAGICSTADTGLPKQQELQCHTPVLISTRLFREGGSRGESRAQVPLWSLILILPTSPGLPSHMAANWHSLRQLPPLGKPLWLAELCWPGTEMRRGDRRQFCPAGLCALQPGGFLQAVAAEPDCARL